MGSKRVLLQSNHGPMIAAESMDVAFDYLVCCAQCPDMMPCACTLKIAALLLCPPAADKCRTAALSSCCSPHVSLGNQLCRCLPLLLAMLMLLFKFWFAIWKLTCNILGAVLPGACSPAGLHCPLKWAPTS